MENNRKLAHIVAYYLSRFNRDALLNLDFKSFNEAFEKTAFQLNVKPNYIKLNRDEFDVAHPHRNGWKNRRMAPSIEKTINALKDLDEQTLTSIVRDLLVNRYQDETLEDFIPLLAIIPDQNKKKQKRVFVPRNITGRKAEEVFMEWFHSDQKSIPKGKDFVDMRDYGCGYDFQIVVSDKQVYGIEVKGFSEDEGGILITGKEWETACKMKKDYYLILVSNINSKPVINVVNNPYDKIFPKRNIQNVIQVNWTVSSKEIRQIKESIS